jgi:hypothetical protein
MADNEEWNSIEVPEKEDKVEYEVEESETQEQKTDSPTEEKDIEELEGIQTKGAEKRIRQLVQQRKERDAHINNLMKKNEELVNHITYKNNELNEISSLTLNSSEKQLTDKIELAREAYMEAFEEGEKEKVLKAQEMLNEAQADLKAVSAAKLRQERNPQPQPQPVQREAARQPTHSPDPKAEEWAASNEWFGKDNVMTAAALAIDAELKGEGYDPNDQDFYKEVNNRIKKAFPQKFGEAKERVQENETKTVSNTSTPAQVVSGSSRSSPGSKGKVKLSQEDVRLAQKWNIPLETYASEKLKVNKAEGDYTDVYTN